MSIGTLILLGWVALVFIAVSGVLMGVLRPTGRSAETGRGDRFGLVERTAAFLASKRVWVLTTIALVGVVSGVHSASQTLHAGVPDPAAREGTNGAAGYGQGAVGRAVDIIYEGVREMAGDVDPRPEHPLGSRIARTAGLATLLLLALELIVKLFHEPIQRLRLRLSHDHIVICGLGRVGRELTATCRAASMRVAVIEREGSNSAITEAEELGAVVCVGDLTSKRVLRVAGVNRARHVFLVSGSDEQNLEAANDLLMVLLEPARAWPSRRPRTPRVTMHLDRPELGLLLSHIKRDIETKAEIVKGHVCNGLRNQAQKNMFSVGVDENASRIRRDGLDLRSFNVADRAIRDLFDEHVLERRPTRPGEVAHFVILGFGPVGRRLALHLAGHAHFENHRRARMTVVYRPEDAGRVDEFRAQYPAFFPCMPAGEKPGPRTDRGDPAQSDRAWSPDPALDDWGYGVHVADVLNPTGEDRGVRFVVNGGFVCDAAGPLSPGVVDRLIGLSRDTSVRLMVFICDAQDEDNCSQGVQLRAELDLRLKQRGQSVSPDEHAVCIFPNVPARPMLSQLTSPKEPRNADLIPFGNAAVSCTYNKLSNDPITRIARAIHLDFFNQYGSPEEDPPSWDDLALWERRSNISAAMHINVKLRVLGYRLVPKSEAESSDARWPDADKISDAVRETIAIIEHNRWMAERLLAGWSLGRREKPENKRRHQFVPWEMLEDGSKDKDFSQIDAVLRICERLTSGPDAGFAIVEC